MKKEISKTTKNKISKYLLPIYIPVAILLIIMLLIINNTNDLGVAAISICIGYGIPILATLVSFILSRKFIKNNFNSDENKLSKKIIFNAITIFTVFIFMMYVAPSIFNFVSLSIFGNSNISSELFKVYFIAILFSILIIPLSRFLNKGNKVSKRDINILVPLFLILQVINYFIVESQFDFWMFLYFLSHITFTFIPAFISSLIDIQSFGKDEKNIKEIIIMIIVIFVYIGCMQIPFNKLYSDKSQEITENKLEENSKPSQEDIDKYTYCLIPYKTKENEVYYGASKTSTCWETGDGKEKNRNLYQIDKNTLKITNLVTNLHSISDFNSSTNNIFYTLSQADQIYELNNDGTYTKVLINRNAPYSYSINNNFYYNDFEQDKNLKVDLNTGISEEINLNDDEFDGVLFIYGDDIYYEFYNETTDKKDVFLFNMKTQAKEKIQDKDVIELMSAIISPLDMYIINNGVRYYIKDDILYLIKYTSQYNVELNTKNENLYLYSYNLITKQIEKKDLTFNNDDEEFGDYSKLRILGMNNNFIYYITFNSNYNEKFNIHKIDLNSLNDEILLIAGSLNVDNYDNNGYYEYNYMKEELDEFNFYSTSIIDNFLYYSDYEKDDGKLYKLNLLTDIKEKISDDNNTIFFDVIDDYVYYITVNYDTQSNSFYRIKDMSRETIIEHK